MSEYV